MKFSYNWLQSYFKEPLPKPDELADLLTTRSFETDKPEKVGDDYLLSIDVLPNRVSDCSSHFGMAKECAVFFGENLSFEIPKFEKNPKLRTEDYVSVEVENPDSCFRYIALLVKNPKIGPSPDWLKERLVSVGQKSINNVVDITNYVMLETGQPLHAFDLKKISGGKIVVRKAESGEKMETLSGQHVALSPNMLVIADEKEPMAVAGIKGGKKSGINEGTEALVIEAAIFNPADIRQTSREIGIQTDASFRFEHGISLILPEIAIERTAQLLSEIAKGDVAATNVDFCPNKPIFSRIFFTEDDVLKLLGEKIKSSDIKKILINLGFKVDREKERFSVFAPRERTDIKIKEDVIEEVARIYGYENIKSKMPEESLTTSERNEEYFFSNFMKGILVDMGFSEVYNYSFSKIGKVELENPISRDKEFLRMNLKTGLVDKVAENLLKNPKLDEIKFFEIGKVFDNNLGEKTHVAIIIANRKRTGEEILQEIKGAIEEFLNKLGIAEIGEFDGCVRRNVFEVDLERIVELTKENIEMPEVVGFGEGDIEYKPFSKYPAIIRDVSLFVPEGTQIVDVVDIIENTGGELLVDTDLFDEYAPPDGGRKSLAFRLIFQSFDKTLTDKEVGDIMDKIIKALDENIQWEVRKK
ncbi:phenylalanine--tRNA ligase subunit beta [Patescibacteria group bacterium]|nr:phenylalanine--tRNA ligase subunit beta [Patescibacteria group bacterium]MBU2633208.1 phenylalanine--tRNA ligase subunit beta [Patescibacteria group bacterium]